MKPPHIFRNMSLRDALNVARDFGACVNTVRGTGEIRVSHPSIRRPVNINNRRNDAPAILIVFLRALGRSLGA